MKRASQMMLTFALMAIMALMVGCQTAPGRTQTQTFKECTFNVMLPAGANPSNVCATANGGAMGDLFTQNMLVDTSGSEVNSPTSTPTTTTPIDVMRGTGGGSSWAELFSGIKSMFGSGTTDNTKTDAAAKAETATGDCADGSCSVGTTTAK
jgi:hypothetical protein